MSKLFYTIGILLTGKVSKVPASVMRASEAHLAASRVSRPDLLAAAQSGRLASLPLLGKDTAWKPQDRDATGADAYWLSVADYGERFAKKYGKPLPDGTYTIPAASKVWQDVATIGSQRNSVELWVKQNLAHYVDPASFSFVVVGWDAPPDGAS